MKRWPKSPVSEEKSLVPAAEAGATLQVKVWLTSISPMVWRRVLVPANFTLRELHGVIQVAMGWEGIHLSFIPVRCAMARGHWLHRRRTSRWRRCDCAKVRGSSKCMTSTSPGAMRYASRAGSSRTLARPIPFAPRVTVLDHPRIAAAENFMDHRDDRFSFDALEDLDTMVEVLQQIALKDGSEALALDQDPSWRLEDALERAKAHAEARERPFSRR
jgi:hypothetical protein